MMQGDKVQKGVKALLLIGLGLFFYSRFTNGTLYFYINQQFAIYTLLAVFGLLLTGLSYRYEQSAAHNHAHDHDHDHRLSWGGAFLVLLPIVLGLLVPPQPLGAAALSNREINTGANILKTPGLARTTAQKQATEKNILDWWESFHGVTNPNQALAGQTVDVVGFVYHDQALGNEHFMVSRFVVSCCVADASAMGLAVRWSAAPQLKDDQWVEVKGAFVAGQLPSWQLPILVAQSVTPVAVPNQPYLYP